jgi:DNA-binding CsgD family transcriptional regulator
MQACAVLGAGAGIRETLCETWRGLVAGRVRIGRQFLTNERSYLELAPTSVESGQTSLPPRTVTAIERALLGGASKAIADDMGLGRSTFAFIVRNGLYAMGLQCTYINAPMILVVIVHAARRGIVPRGVLAETRTQDGRCVRTIGVERPDAWMGDTLTPSEHAVIGMRLEGKRYDEIAVARRTSLRTVANQISAVHRKLGTSGRIDLISRLIERGTPGSAVDGQPDVSTIRQDALTRPQDLAVTGRCDTALSKEY